MSYTFMAPTKVADELARPIRESLSSTARARGAELIERFTRPGVTMNFIDIEAAPTRGLHEHLDQGKYDLAVVGSHGRRGFRRWMLGSVAESTVRHAPCSVLVVHPPEQEASDE
jgi:nucleotide-binding universal stress UspA family protein